jgi:hypothetical protein
MKREKRKNKKYYFEIAESDNGIDGFRFRDRPVAMPALNNRKQIFTTYGSQPMKTDGSMVYFAQKCVILLRRW